MVCKHANLRVTAEVTPGGQTFPLTISIKAWCADCGQQIVFAKGKKSEDTSTVFRVSGRAEDGEEAPAIRDNESPPPGRHVATRKVPKPSLREEELDALAAIKGGPEVPMWDRADVEAWCGDYAERAIAMCQELGGEFGIEQAVGLMRHAIQQAVTVGDAPWESYKALLKG